MFLSSVLYHLLNISGSFALKDDGSVWSLKGLTKLDSLKNIKEISGDNNNLVALSTDGKVYTWNPKDELREFLPDVEQK
jgi:alpha-tubulin suppressor-like RCC1 family protein